MKVLLVLSSILLASLAHPDYSDTWEEFKEKFNKQYDTEDDETYRQGVWSSNVESIKAHNGEAESGLHTFTLGENEFADMTSDEITSFYNGLTHAVPTRPELGHTESQAKLGSLPTAIDWREKKVVTPVKNQKMCGSCWAFSATGSLEAAHALSNKTLVSLSEQNLVDCSKKEGNLGCFGGLMDHAFQYVKDNGGIDTEASYPYTATTGKTCLYNATNSGATLKSWVDLPHGSEADLQKAVATVGPVSVGIDASRPKFHFYKKGVYHDKTCSSIRLDHGVLVVGYGSGKADTDHKAQDYWIVKNSWGASWGMEGYIHMSRNRKNNCGIASQAATLWSSHTG